MALLRTQLALDLLAGEAGGERGGVVLQLLARLGRCGGRSRPRPGPASARAPARPARGSRRAPCRPRLSARSRSSSICASSAATLAPSPAWSSAASARRSRASASSSWMPARPGLQEPLDRRADEVAQDAEEEHQVGEHPDPGRQTEEGRGRIAGGVRPARRRPGPRPRRRARRAGTSAERGFMPTSPAACRSSGRPAPGRAPRASGARGDLGLQLALGGLELAARSPPGSRRAPLRGTPRPRLRSSSRRAAASARAWFSLSRSASIFASACSAAASCSARAVSTVSRRSRRISVIGAKQNLRRIPYVIQKITRITSMTGVRNQIHRGRSRVGSRSEDRSRVARRSSGPLRTGFGRRGELREALRKVGRTDVEQPEPTQGRLPGRGGM